MSLLVMVILGLIVGATVFAVAMAIVLCSYLIIGKRKAGNDEHNIDRFSEIRPGINEMPSQRIDEQVLKAWDEHVRKTGGYSNEDWVKILRNRKDK